MRVNEFLSVIIGRIIISNAVILVDYDGIMIGVIKRKYIYVPTTPPALGNRIPEHSRVLEEYNRSH